MEYKIQRKTLTAIADAIRAKTGSAAPLTPGQMAQVIAGIEAGGDSLFSSEATGEIAPVVLGTASSEFTVGFASAVEAILYS